ncbi:uncharacterized protein LOC130507395 isoform X2 [Raphanus sativus]|uniref:Uncharacterized protein LOC130501430 isoform X2 n=1 Tax=Raphanus sativus TaxID=3726 RepID=A0A9W3D2S7_RAPSA|nr:uncharacterized protein LOC130501430 isoform X2 [Raphanus sativus]XP_056858092.1 uncharacterized protein LOC130507395 isoform X2 [Raphanus sativus]
MTSEGSKMSSSQTRSPLATIPENVGDDVVERNSTDENVSSEEEAAAASDVNPLASDAAQILPMLQNLLRNNDIQRERLTGLVQLYAPAVEDTNANVNAESEQIAREAALASQVHFLEQRVQELEEEIETQKKLNAELEEQLKSLTNSSDP